MRGKGEGRYLKIFDNFLDIHLAAKRIHLYFVELKLLNQRSSKVKFRIFPNNGR